MELTTQQEQVAATGETSRQPITRQAGRYIGLWVKATVLGLSLVGIGKRPRVVMAQIAAHCLAWLEDSQQSGR